MNSTVTTVFCREDDPVRSVHAAQTAGMPSKKVFLRALQGAMGNVNFDRDGRRVYFTGPNLDKVRRVINVDAVANQAARNVEDLYAKHVDPLVVRAVEQQRDVVVVCAGDSRSQKAALVHGSVPEFTLDVPPRSAWGMALLTVDRLLDLSTTVPLDISCTFARIHLEHISDVLVSIASKVDRSDPDKVRAHYSRLVSLSQGSSLDLEEAPDGAKVKFQMLDQVDAPIKGLDDFLHIINCRGALTAAHGPLMKLISKKGVPFYYVLSLTILPADASPIGATPRYINFIETADLDWTGPEEDMASFNSSLRCLADTAAAIERGSAVAAEIASRSSTVGRLALGNCDIRKTDLVFLGCAKYANALRMMKTLADCKGQRPFVLLHGPDGEGEDDVDPELREHVMAVQSQCDNLRAEVDALRQRKDELDFQITKDDKTISRLQEQNTLVRKMTMSAKAAKDALGTADPGRGRNSAATTPASLREQKRAESEARKLARLATLDRDLALMKEEDARKADATNQQIRFLNQESKRCAANAVALEKELAQLEKSLSDQESRFQLERQQREQEMEEQISNYIAQNRTTLESRNAARRAAIRNTQDAIMHNHEVSVRQEKLFLEELQRNTTDLAKKIEAENAQWEQKLEALSRQLVEASQQRDAVAAENRAAQARFDNEMRALDMEAVVLCKYLNDITNVIWRFENHTGTDVRRVVTVPKCGVSVFDMAAKHSAADLQRMCRRTRSWLEARGLPKPIVHHNVATGEMSVLPQAMESLTRLTNSGDVPLGDALQLLRSPMRARASPE